MSLAPSLNRRGPDHRALREIHGHDGMLVGFLVSTRLAITDALNARANMPFLSENGELALVFNGQIYNHRELRAQLGSRYTFRTRSDTEVVLAAYARWGERMFEHFDGMYAFCLFDRHLGRVLLAVDHAGQKPLYYYLHPRGEHIVFGSDIDTLLTSGLVPFELDVPALQELVIERYIRDEQTHLEHVRKLLNGTYAVFEMAGSARSLAVRRHFSFRIDEACFDHVDTAIAELGSAIVAAEETVIRNCELPTAFLLSGGMDSSAMVALASRHTPAIDAYMLGFLCHVTEQQVLGEVGSAERFLTWLSETSSAALRRVRVLLTPDQFPALIDRWSAECPHLLYNRDALFLYHLFEAVRQDGYKVAVTGCGPDEIFDGYSYGAILSAAAAEDYPLTLAHYGASKLQAQLDTNALLWGQESELARRVCGKINHFLSLYPPSLSPLQGAQLINWHTRSQYECLKSDIASSLFGVEARKPYYSRRVVELAFQFPGAWKRNDNQEKWILRRALVQRGILPAQVANRKKLAFPHPGNFQPSGAGRQRMREVLSGPNALRESGALDFDVVLDHFERTEGSGEQLSEMLYGLCLSLDKQGQTARKAAAALVA